MHPAVALDLNAPSLLKDGEWRHDFIAHGFFVRMGVLVSFIHTHSSLLNE
jgi:hypothetical protein